MAHQRTSPTDTVSLRDRFRYRFDNLLARGMWAVLLSGVNPKNLGLTIAAAATIGGAGLSSGEEIIVMVVFVLIASLTVAAPVILNLLLGSKAEHTLTEMKEWLIDNNATVMSVLFVVLGAKVLGAGISIVA